LPVVRTIAPVRFEILFGEVGKLLAQRGGAHRCELMVNGVAEAVHGLGDGHDVAAHAQGLRHGEGVGDGVLAAIRTGEGVAGDVLLADCRDGDRSGESGIDAAGEAQHGFLEASFAEVVADSQDEGVVEVGGVGGRVRR
jgi:hypothetical protein